MAQWRRDLGQIVGMAGGFDGFAHRVNQLGTDTLVFAESIGDSSVISAFNAVLTDWSIERDRLTASLESAASALRAVASQYEHDEVKLAGGMDAQGGGSSS